MTSLSITNNIELAAESAINYFNTHTEGLGYIDSLVEIQPKAGQNFSAFWTLRFCMLEGNPQDPEKLYISLTIPGANALHVLMPFLGDINSQNTKVFVNIRLAKFRADPFIYGVNSKTPGTLGVNYSARLINIIYLKVGDNEIKLEGNNEEARPALNAQSLNNHHHGQQLDHSLFVKPLMVKLSKDDVNFSNEKDRLYKAGYRWHSEKMLWIIPEVIIVQDADYVAKVGYLESMGYIFSSAHAAWRMAFSQPKSNNRNVK